MFLSSIRTSKRQEKKPFTMQLNQGAEFIRISSIWRKRCLKGLVSLSRKKQGWKNSAELVQCIKSNRSRSFTHLTKRQKSPPKAATAKQQVNSLSTVTNNNTTGAAQVKHQISYTQLLRRQQRRCAPSDVDLFLPKLSPIHPTGKAGRLLQLGIAPPGRTTSSPDQFRRSLRVDSTLFPIPHCRFPKWLPSLNKAWRIKLIQPLKEPSHQSKAAFEFIGQSRLSRPPRFNPLAPFENRKLDSFSPPTPFQHFIYSDRFPWHFLTLTS